MTALIQCIRPAAVTIALAFLFFSCNQGGNSAEATALSSPAPSVKTLALGVFSDFPPEIDGCACYFSAGQEAFGRREWIYADDYVNTAFLSIDGRMTKFNLTDASTPSDIRTVKTFRNDAYELTLDLTQLGQLDETWQHQGKLTLRSADGTVVTRDIYGECGC